MKSGESFAPLQFFKGSRLRKRVEQVLQTPKRNRIGIALAATMWIVLMLPGELLAKHIVKDQLQEIEVYEFLQERNFETGQVQFCKKCTYEVWENCYLEVEELCTQ